MNRFDLSNKWAIVTGAGGLLGREHSFALAETGANVILTDINTDSTNILCNDLKEQFSDQSFHSIEMNVADESSVRNALTYSNENCGKIDILINNAAIDPKVKKDENKLLEDSRLENFSIESWDFQVAVGLTGAMICSKVFGTEMAKNGHGVILNISSDLSIMAPDQRLYKKDNLEEELQPVKPVTYSVIKHGLIGLTKYMATYWADKGVRVNALSPGGVYNNQPDGFVEKLADLIPMGRMANKDEYRGCVQFLCSNASSYMTGQNLAVEGGRSVW